MTMRTSPLSENENQRLQAVMQYNILDSAEEADYNDIVELASHLCDTPIALITLIDKHRQWFKARKGLQIQETPIDISFCAHTIHQNDVMIVPDAAQDDRFFHNPLVTGPPFIRFYAGVTLSTPSGFPLGSLAVIDQTPRSLTSTQVKGLKILAKQVTRLLELRLSNQELDSNNQELHKRVDEKMIQINDILDRVSDSFTAVDKDWNVTFLNRQAQKISNRSKDEIIGQNLWAAFPEAFASDFPRLAKLAMESQQPQYMETFFEPYQGWFATNIYPSESGLSLYVKDITERKAGEHALKEAVAKYRGIFENAVEGIFQSTLAGKFLTVNPAMAKMLEYNSPEELVGSIDDIGEQLYTDPEKRSEITNKLAEEESINGLEINLRKKNGGTMWARCNVRLVRDELGNKEYYEGTIQDISDRKLAEEKLLCQFAELQKANQELDRFVYSASHDLRAPLATMLGLINLARGEEELQQLKQYLKMVEVSINRLDGFIKDILDYSLNARKSVKIEEVDFARIINDVVSTYAQDKVTENLKINTEITGVMPFHSDRSRISIILKNIISNSIKYCDGSKPESRIDIRVSCQNKNALITVSDNGVGIENIHVGKVFEMFYRGTENAKGSGLGLYIAKETATRLGGTIELESKYGQGTTLSISLPDLTTR